MEELRIFEREEFGSVRVIMHDGEPWFVASDVARALGYANPAEAIQDHCKKVNKINHHSKTLPPSPPVNILIIPESDVYRLVMRSNLPNAEKFQDWVVEEVLPSIRKSGSYSMAPKTYPEALRALAAEVELREAEKQQRLLAEQQRDEAIRTKAQIGSRREATAMNTASRLSKENARLVEEYTERGTYMAVTAIPFLTEICVPCKALWQQAGKKLTALSERMKFPIHTIPDSRFGTVKKYHKEVIEAFRVQLINDPNMLGKYRRAA